MDAKSQEKHKYIGGRAKQYKFAAYLEHWRQSVEKVGNINYPETARTEKLKGDLVLDVTISSDGSISDTKILRPSGLKVLDDAARRIAHLAAPYQPFPASFSQEIDKLHVIRTWEFQYNKLKAKPLEK